MLKILCLKGGIGNQIFEYCQFQQLIDQQHTCFLHYDVRRLKQHNSQRIDQVFHITLPHEPFWVKMYLLLLKVFRRFGVFTRLYDDEREDCTLIDDYCQNKSAIVNARDILAFKTEALTNEAKELKIEIEKVPHPVALHVRRGDYLHPSNAANFGTCGMEYYTTAMELIRSKHPDAQFYIFSDDTEWCAQQSAFKDCKIVQLNHTADYISMYLMTLCKNHIIANSTFSFWGAFLSPYLDGINIYPAQWFANKDWNKPDFLPESWVAI